METRDSQVEIISVHVPKTAGTTMRKCLIQVYGKEKNFLDYKKEQLNQVLSEINKQNIRVIHGHFQLQKYDGHFLEAKRIIWLREPIKRLISNYWHQITHFQNRKISHYEVELEKEKLLNWAKKPNLRNFLSRRYIQKNIENFWFVGITEFLREDLTEIQTMLEWPEVEITQINKHNYPKMYQAFIKSV
ncbi:MAG: sulfotransferase family protein [Okeania sp. SIO2F4]|uniref:sulfotransferase family 2 domain-containing protein n=1 Tax=Okeania sp. SIO2F4 TaxID=2607790 RepID=UPI00142B8D80|nr:sulfotransferase family 2 domain-containing protein [Okeania sp. SIO2F4]NES04571.1 sulfotransferase family protein [Okeania sp. SIO2F4]